MILGLIRSGALISAVVTLTLASCSSDNESVAAATAPPTQTVDTEPSTTEPSTTDPSTTDPSTVEFVLPDRDGPRRELLDNHTNTQEPTNTQETKMAEHV